MLGVVLWAGKTQRKAVFWCEDQGDLAYFDATSEAGADHQPFHAGDLVAFDVSVVDDIRRARNPRLVEQKACDGLDDSLKKSAAEQPMMVSTTSPRIVASNVISLTLPAANSQPPRNQRSGSV